MHSLSPASGWWVIIHKRKSWWFHWVNFYWKHFKPLRITIIFPQCSRTFYLISYSRLLFTYRLRNPFSSFWKSVYYPTSILFHTRSNFPCLGSKTSEISFSPPLPKIHFICPRDSTVLNHLCTRLLRRYFLGALCLSLCLLFIFPNPNTRFWKMSMI